MATHFLHPMADCCYTVCGACDSGPEMKVKGEHFNAQCTHAAQMAAEPDTVDVEEAHLVRVSFTMRETIPLASCLWLLSAISAYTQHRHTCLVSPGLTPTLLLELDSG